MNIMLVSVTERTREIGLRKAVGATRPRILVDYLLEGMLLAVFSGLAGWAGAFGLADDGQQHAQAGDVRRASGERNDHRGRLRGIGHDRGGLGAVAGVAGGQPDSRGGAAL